MSSPMIEIPVPVCVPMDVEAGSGFPFDRPDRDDTFRSQFDDIVNRHPEFAEHLEGFPSLRRSRRPFGSSRFERFGFPFDRDDPFDDRRQTQAQSQPEAATASTQTEEAEEGDKPTAPERGRNKNIQQSNTVDLGQKQEPVNERNQRSMSAPPPDNRQRFVSSIQIPINRDGAMEQPQPQQQPQQQQQEKTNKPTERVIPIHVEGRDEPVLPKHNTGPSFSQPQPERVFGHKPTQFTQFTGRDPRQFGGSPDWHKTYETKPQQQQQAKPTAQVPPQQKPRQEPEQEQQQKPATNTPIDLIQSIQRDVSSLMTQVENFSGAPKDKQYLYLDEMLTRNLIKLDNIDTQGQENIRQARKEAIKCIESCIGVLEAKAAANVAPQAAEAKQEEVKMDVEAKGEEAKVEEVAAATSGEHMDVVVAPAEEVEVAKVSEDSGAVTETAEPKQEEQKADEEVNDASEKKAEEAAEAADEDKEGETEADDKKEKKKSKKKVAKK